MTLYSLANLTASSFVITVPSLMGMSRQPLIYLLYLSFVSCYLKYITITIRKTEIDRMNLDEHLGQGSKASVGAA